ncbi:MAG: magnesium chelatase domain-containing protein, partial [Solirubrobacterales bacterium]
MLAKTVSFTVDGTAVRPVEVEVDVCRGLPSFGLVGLPDTAVREARERVRSAMENSGFDFPLRRITASLAPAELHRNGGTAGRSLLGRGPQLGQAIDRPDRDALGQGCLGAVGRGYED